MIRLKLLDLLEDESPTYERIRFLCTAPKEDGSPWLELPRTYELEDPTTYFTTDIKVRHASMLTRSNWAMAFRAITHPPGRKAGDGEQEESPPKAGDGQTTPRKTQAQTSQRAGAPKLLGSPLSRSEAGRSLDHRPKSPGGRYICWDPAALDPTARTLTDQSGS